MSVAEGGLDAPDVYDFGEVETRWQGLWEDEHASDTTSAAETPHGTYYVLQLPPHPGDNPPRGQLKTAAFADALTQYHRSRGRRVLTEYDHCALDDVRAPNWSNNLTEFHSHIAGHGDGVELIFGCTQIDQARQLTKTLARMNVMAANAPRVRALALGLVTDDDHVPIPTAQPYIDRYGADTVRCYTIFMGPHEHDLPWSQGQIAGVHRFLGRLWRLGGELADTTSPAGLPNSGSATGADLELLRKTHQTIDHVTNTMESDLRLHLAIAAIMGLVSGSIRVRDQAQPGTLRFVTQSAARLLFPFAPHCGAEVYHRLTGERVWEAPWPVADPLFTEVVVPGKLVD